MSGVEYLSEREEINLGINYLAEHLFREGIDKPSGSPKIAYPFMKKGVWIASVLASSEDQVNQRKALEFGILAYQKFRGTPREEVFETFLYLILSRVGNLPAVQNLHNNESRSAFQSDMASSYDPILNLEMEYDYEKHRVGKEDFVSSFQKEIMNSLYSGNDVAISGPTSSGKSHMLKEYIDDRIHDDPDFQVIYIVPSRALIAEVSSELKELHDDVTVRTGAYRLETEIGKPFLVVTPERCLKLFDEDILKSVDPDLIFFDEIQTLENGERGVVFEDVVSSIKTNWPDAQLVGAGPYLNDPAKTLEKISEREVTEVKTILTPILQQKSVVRFRNSKKRKNRKMDVFLHTQATGKPHKFRIPEPEALTYSDFDSSIKQSIPHLIEYFGDGDNNLIYANTPRWAEERAEAVENHREARDLNDDEEELVEFLSDTIHEDYRLTKCVKKGVAFHHGKVPKIVRETIEDLYASEDSHLDTIVSTTTLMEGVNLPAKNMFVFERTKSDEDLTDFEFKNLVGRVGRLHQNLYGTIYCIEAEDEWANEPLSSEEQKTIESTTDQSIESDYEGLLDALSNENLHSLESGVHRYTGILLRNKYLKNPDEVKSYLRSKDISDQQREAIYSQLESRLNDVSVSDEILKRHPTVDPVLIQKLRKSVDKDPSKWIVANGRDQFLSPQGDFEIVTRRLNKLFRFTNDNANDIYPPDLETKHGEMQPIEITADQWLKGFTYNRMIGDRRRSVEDESLSKAIRSVMELVNDDTRFVLVKYYGILTDVFEELGVDVSDWMLNFDQMLEMGSMNFNELELMSRGVDRSVTIELDIPTEVQDVDEYLEQKTDIKEFYKRHLERQGVL